MHDNNIVIGNLVRVVIVAVAAGAAEAGRRACLREREHEAADHLDRRRKRLLVPVVGDRPRRRDRVQRLDRLAQRRQHIQALQAPVLQAESPLAQLLLAKLPFALTNAQRRVWAEIAAALGPQPQ